MTSEFPWEYITSLNADDFVDILLKGKDEKEKDRLFFRWCLLEVHNYGEPISFNDYLYQMRPKPVKSTKKILEETNDIINQFNRGYRKIDL